jgi:tetratricopeptide (TPR) repeat protein/2-polyprenyl-3-methyl-5-hydroxy-6-metoxy-1,4-benzoquinol methylase
MNRKQRRAARKKGKRVSTSTNYFSDAFLLAVAHYQAGRIPEAEGICRKNLAVNPAHGESLHLLGLIAHKNGRNDLAIELVVKAIAANPEVGNFHLTAGSILLAMGRRQDAIACYRRASMAAPDSAEVHIALANVLFHEQRLDEARLECEQAIRIKADSTAALYLLGNIFQLRNRLDEAIERYQQALRLQPNFPEVHNNLGNAFRMHGNLQAAVVHIQRSLVLKPDNPEALNNLGLALQQQGLFAEAVESYKKALALRPNLLAAHKNLCSTQLSLGNVELALFQSLRAIEVEETVETKALFVQCVRLLRDHNMIPEVATVRRLLIRALSEPWGRPSELASFSARLLKMEAPISQYLEHEGTAATVPIGLLQSPSVCENELLVCLLRSTPIGDFALERFLTAARRSMLDFAESLNTSTSVDQDLIALACVLAQQCFINEYVFWFTDDEFGKASRLRDLLLSATRSGHPVPDLWIVVVAMYFSLHSLSLDTAQRGLWSNPAVSEVIKQQLTDPQQEQRYQNTIPRLTDISDTVSLSVQHQYEENPYPKWVKTAVMSRPSRLEQFLGDHFPRACLSLFRKPATDILIAGCGTGQQVIEAATKFLDAQVLAVDLSLASLCYAARKTHEAGLANVRYAQADILQMQEAGETFDLIETTGVLHHLSDPFAGWQALLSLLRPGGFMRVALYSAIARRSITEVKEFIAKLNYNSASVADIRRFRQDLAVLNQETFSQVATKIDFYSVSGCRDAFFNVQEHRMTIPDIARFLAENHLEFMGFSVDGQTLQQFRRRFSSSDGASHLDLWHLFEIENPDTFIGMYQFWIQKQPEATR